MPRKAKQTRSPSTVNPKPPAGTTKMVPLSPRRTYVKYPPRTCWPDGVTDLLQLPNLYVHEHALSEEAQWFFEDLVVYEDENKKPERFSFVQLMTLVAANNEKVYPPREVLEWLAPRVWAYFQARGSKRLDECLGLVGRPGVESYFTKQKKEFKEREFCLYVDALREGWNISIEKAAEIVSNLPHALSADTILTRYKKDRRWKTWRMESRQIKIDGVYHSYLIGSEQNCRRFLKQFPYDSLPSRIKPHHPSHKLL